LEGLATKVFEFGNKRVKEHFEDITGFLRKKKMENLKEIERKK
jgi:ATP-binding cassette subfamily F protein 3